MSGPSRRPVLGLVVNPIAGIGGPAGFKGSDGDDTVRLALGRGAVPHAGDRALGALQALARAWPGGAPLPAILAAEGAMGEAAVRAAGLDLEATVPVEAHGEQRDGAGGPFGTTADDTRRAVAALAVAGVDLLLLAGGDGTAADVCAAGISLPVVGIPAGVKMHSAVFAVSPAAAGELAAAFLAAPPASRRTESREVLDMDEAAYRLGVVAPRLVGELIVPVERRRLQARKEPSPVGDAAAVDAAAAGVVALLVPGRRYVLGPGSTMRAVKERLGIAATLVGVDVAEAAADGRAVSVATDADEAALLSAVEGRDAAIVLTPIGGQGFLLGRGNQQIGARVVRAVGALNGSGHLMVVATTAKIAALGGRPLLVDTGDPALDRDLAGYVRVVTGPAEATIYPVAAA
jgi:predicted polyphosphate/ATP-dependent NAD kinase